MVVFKYPSQTVAGVNEYVVSIAGTKATSIFDEIDEDLLVGKLQTGFIVLKPITSKSLMVH
ncbi:hypothetical protein [Chryseobacterium indoltheticum]|uniref:hypothetical protein n=1 Tax=Chryseobacterium indoltheticum TaxID=254 RepID=UPI003F4986FA